MNKFLKITLATAALSVAGLSQAAPYVFQFPSLNSTVVASVGALPGGDIGYFWSVARGDGVTESYLSSGVFGTASLELDLFVGQNGLRNGAFGPRSSATWSDPMNARAESPSNR